MSDKWLTLVPAYGRDYKSDDDVLKHWQENKDFRIADISCPWDGHYVGRGQVEDEDDLKDRTFKIRYNGKADFVLVKRIDGVWHKQGTKDKKFVRVN